MASLLRLPEVKRRTGLSTTDIYDGQKKETFPRSVPIGERTVGWVDTEVDAWVDARIRARETTPLRKAGPGRRRHSAPQTVG